jgi:glycosyltransferase involved in cell wall biosynthesis
LVARSATASDPDLQSLVDTFHPEVIFIWHAHGLPRAVLQAAEKLPRVETVYYFANYLPEMADEYFEYWKSRPQSKPAPVETTDHLARPQDPGLGRQADHSEIRALDQRQWLRAPTPAEQRFDRSGCSGYPQRRRPGDVPLRAEWEGVDRPRVGSPQENGSREGIHTLLQAFSLLRKRGQLRDIHLTLVGDGPRIIKPGCSRLWLKEN